MPHALTRVVDCVNDDQSVLGEWHGPLGTWALYSLMSHLIIYSFQWHLWLAYRYYQYCQCPVISCTYLLHVYILYVFDESIHVWLKMHLCISLWLSTRSHHGLGPSIDSCTIYICTYLRNTQCLFTACLPQTCFDYSTKYNLSMSFRDLPHSHPTVTVAPAPSDCCYNTLRLHSCECWLSVLRDSPGKQPVTHCRHSTEMWFNLSVLLLLHVRTPAWSSLHLGVVRPTLCLTASI